MKPSPLYSLTALTIAGFVLLFIYAFHQLVQIQQAVHTGTGKNMLWTISQAEREARKLDNALLDAGGRPDGLTEVSHRLDILVSRIAMFNEGPQHDYFLRIGLGPKLEQSTRSMRDITAILDPGIVAGRIEADRVRAVLVPMMDDLGRLANRATLAELDDASQNRQNQSKALTLAIAAVVGLMLTGAFLIWRLLASTRAAVQSGHALAEHKARLEAMVQERTAALSTALEKEKTTSEIYRSFITTVSHQFRTPLSIIDMVAQSFIRRPAAFPPEIVAEKALRIRNACIRLMRMLESTTNAARLDGGAVPVEMVNDDLAHIAENACTYQRELSPERRILLEAESRDFSCRADSALIEQVLLNLLSNATKYSPANEPIVVSITGDADHVRCAVSDRGIGIPAADREKIFTRFFRAGNAVYIPGTGLGLNLSRAIVALHGGTLDFAPAADVGTVFTMTLPRRKEA
ncbi:sensor histidine kinase [Allorhizobium borbori]|uniref:histidine kinase n=1 Tax=Allorhizobium borbori TaxID=485907 RepID=A0A7W6K204_9HYPH|nr:HAMP domain-containing sensor histidine kinase [Allorhizobium borbori]MBB4103720.1 signal transduction histidine kinase [Allorhizobium borbori]